MKQYSNKFRTCGCIIEYNGEYLFVHQVASGFWGFPKGTKNSDETTQECAIRELREETGIVVNSEYLGVSFDWNKSRMYLVSLAEKPRVMVDGVEIDDYKWEKLDFLQENAISKLTRTMMNRIVLQKRDNMRKKIENHDLLLITV